MSEAVPSSRSTFVPQRRTNRTPIPIQLGATPAMRRVTIEEDRPYIIEII
jgi:hypothetical protein